MDPINYGAFQRPSNLFGNFLSGLQSGAGVSQIVQQREAAERDKALAEEMEASLRDYSQNPTAEGAAALMGRYPKMSEGIKRSWDTLESSQRAKEFEFGQQVYAAALSGKPEIAAKLVRDRAAAKRNSGMEADAEKDDRFASLIESNPSAALTVGGLYLAGGMGPAEFEKTFSGLRTTSRADALQGDAEKKAAAEARSSEIAAKYADQTARLDLAKKDEEIRASKENTRLRAIEASMSRETNDLKRQELQQKLDAARKEVDLKAMERLSEADTAIAGIDDAKALLSDLLSKDNRDDLLAAIGGGALRASIPGTRARAVAGRIEQLQNSIASANLDKLKGAMSDKDIIFLKNIATSLDRYQDEKSFIAELERIDTTLDRSRMGLEKRYGVSVPQQQPNISTGGATVTNW